MKRSLTLLLAAAFIFGAVAQAQARTEILVKGDMNFAFGIRNGVSFQEFNEDDFIARQRFRTQIEFVASETLRAVLHLEIGTHIWGRDGFTIDSGSQPWNNGFFTGSFASGYPGPYGSIPQPSSGIGSGGELDGDGVNIRTKWAYLDWAIPDAKMRLRLGIQPIFMPGVVARNPVFSGDVAGVTAAFQFNKEFGLTAFWARPYDTYEANQLTGNTYDAMDMFGVTAAYRNKYVSVMPWAIYSSIGNASDFWRNRPMRRSNVGIGGFPLMALTLGGGLYQLPNITPATTIPMFYDDGDSDLWYGGLGVILTPFEDIPLTAKFDVIYGNLQNNGSGFSTTEQASVQNGGRALNATQYGNLWGAGGLASRAGYNAANPAPRDLAITGNYNPYGNLASFEGWFIDAAIDYKMSWGTPGIFGWWSSGDDADAYTKKEYGRIPVVNGNPGWGMTSFGFIGQNALVHAGAMSATGVGTWGVGVQVKDVSFYEDLFHTLRFAYYRGTNDSAVVADVNARDPRAYVINPNNGVLMTPSTILGVNGELHYMTDKDAAFEINFDHRYKVDENLTLNLDLGYIYYKYDQDVWTMRQNAAGSVAPQNVGKCLYTRNDAWKAQLMIEYKF